MRRLTRLAQVFKLDGTATSTQRPTYSAVPDSHPEAFDSETRLRLLTGFRALAEADDASLDSAAATVYSQDVAWRGSHPMNEIAGCASVVSEVWRPLREALPDLERRDEIFVCGEYQGRQLVAAMGHYCGTFDKPWLGIPPTGHPLWVRYGEVHQIENGKIVQSSCLWDVLDVMHQAGFQPLAASLGHEYRWGGPLTADGIRLQPSPPEQGADSIAQTLAMHATLAGHDDRGNLSRQALLDMPQKEHWHPKMMWYGPSGIGTTRALSGFVDRHQLPFRHAFPGRKAGDALSAMIERGEAPTGGGHYIRIGDGPYSVTGGWPSVYAPHEGGSIFGIAGTGKLVGMRVMDFYLHHEGLIRENWVPIDVIDLLLQLGVDVFDRMQLAFDRR